MYQYKVKKFSYFVQLIYVVGAIVLFFLMGEQLHLRDSRNNIVSPIPDGIVSELTEGIQIEQYFSIKMQRLCQLQVQWSTFHRENSGLVVIQLWNIQEGVLLFSSELESINLSDGEITTLEMPEPIEDLHQVPLMLRIYSPQGMEGTSVSLYKSTTQTLEQGSLFINGELIEGSLCFAVLGEDYIWTGIHYWKFVVICGIILFLFLLYNNIQVKNNRNSTIVTWIIGIERYEFLVRQFVTRDFRGKYKRSVLGVFWSLLNPFLTMTVQYIVFSELFRFDVLYYPVYLICGIITFNFFVECCNLTLTSIVGNAGLITKVYVPKFIYPFTRTLSSFVNLLISLVPLIAVSLFSGISPTKAYLILPFILLCITGFSYGVGLILCTLYVFFRDTQFIWGILSMIWMYLTPIFYPVDILPEKFAWIVEINPLYHFITFIRTLIIDGISPEPIVFVQCAIQSVIVLWIGCCVFKKYEEQFVLYI